MKIPATIAHAFLLCCSSAPALAVVTPDQLPLLNPKIVPTPAVSGVPLVLRFRAVGCGGWGDPTITRNGNVVSVLQNIVDPCGVPPPEFVHEYELGTFASGDYTLVWQPFNNFVGTAGYMPVVISFTVVKAAAAPALSNEGAALLAAALGLVALGLVRAARSDAQP
jgi:hypothetical protein